MTFMFSHDQLTRHFQNRLEHYNKRARVYEQRIAELKDKMPETDEQAYSLGKLSLANYEQSNITLKSSLDHTKREASRFNLYLEHMPSDSILNLSDSELRTYEFI